MSTTIDNKVVEMSFDNSKFESGVKTSISTLDRLKEALNFDRSTSTFKNLEAAANGIDVSGATNSFSELASKILSLTPAITIVQDLTKAAEGLVKTLASNTIGKIIQGGYKRSSNLQDAKFMLEGLKVEWDDILEDIEYGVSDTAYGLDAAAKAASSLVASGVNIGDDMKQSLRGISGVAAMTNSSYEEISSIFTTVAGQGKVMTMQLRQLETRGMNAAATLGEYLGKSEAAVREMVTKGEIDFATFSAAMDEAFGEHAKDSNKTLQGVLSNIGSALSRVGQRFIEPIIANEGPLVNMLNAVRLGINEINAALEPISSKVIPFLTNDEMTGILDKITSKIRGLTSGWNQVSQIFGNVGITTSDLTSRLYTLYEGTDKGTKFEEAIKNTKAFKDQLEKLGGEAKDFSGEKLINFIKGTDAMKQAIGNIGIESKDLVDILNATSRGLRDQAKAGGENADAYEKQADKIDQLLHNIEEGTVSLDEVVKAFNTESPIQIAMNGVVSIFKAFSKVLYAIKTGFSRAFSSRNIKSASQLATAFENVGKRIDEFMTKDTVNKLADLFDGLFSIIDLGCELIFGAFKLAFTIIQSLFGATSGSALDLASNTGKALTSFHDFVIEGGFIADTFETIGNWITFVIDAIKGFIGKVKELPIVQDIFENLKDLAVNAFGKIKEVILEVWDALQDINSFSFNKLRESLNGIFKSEKDDEDKFSIVDVFKNFSKNIDDSVDGAEKSVKNFIDKITAPLSNFKDKIKDHLHVNFEDIFAIGAVVMMILTLNNIMKVMQSILDIMPNFNQYLAILTRSVVNVVNKFGALIDTAKKSMWVNALATAFRTLAEGIIILAGAIYILSKIDKDKAIQGVGSIVVTVGMLELVLADLMFVSKKTKIDSKGMLKIIAAIGALAAIAAALTFVSTKMKDVSLGSWLATMGSIVVVTGVMLATLKIIDKSFNKSFDSYRSASMFLEASGAILLMAGALAILSKIDVDKSMIGKLVSLVGVAAATLAVFKILSYYDGKAIDKSSIVGMLTIPLAILEYAAILKLIGNMDFSGVNVGQLVAITLSLITLVGLISAIGKHTSGIGKELIALAAAVLLMDLVIKSFKKIKLENVEGIVIGCGAVFASLLALATFINLTAGKQISSANKYLIEVAGTVALLTGTIWLLGKIELSKLAKGVAAVSVLMLVIAAVTRVAGTIGDASAALLKIGILVGILSAIVLVFKIVGDESASVLIAATSLGIMIAALAGLMYALGKLDSISGKAIGSAILGTIFIAAMGAIIVEYYKLGGKAEGAIQIASSLGILLTFMSANAWILSKIDKVALKGIGSVALLTVIVAALAGIIGVLVTKIGDKADATLKITTALSVMLLSLTLSITILSIVGSLASSAIPGIIAMSVAVVLIGGLCALFGELEGTAPYIEKGIPIIKKLGEGIIDIAKYFLDSVIDSLVGAIPKVGKALKQLSTDLKPFTDYVATLNMSTVKGTACLVALVAELGAAELISSIQSIIGISNFDSFALKLQSFGKAIAGYLSILKTSGITDADMGLIDTTANVGRKLVDLANAIGDGSIFGMFDAVQDVASFGLKLTAFGGALVGYGSLVKNLPIEAIEASAAAAQMMVDLSNKLPETKTLGGWFSSSDANHLDMEDFGKQLLSFGKHLVKYSVVVSSLDVGAVTCSKIAADTMLQLAKNLPETKTVSGWFSSKDANHLDMEDFGNQLITFGKKLSKYSEIVSTVDPLAVTLSRICANIMVELANNLPETKSIGRWFSTSNPNHMDMEDFGNQLVSFGKHLSSYSKKVKDVDSNVVTKSRDVASAMVELANKLPATNGLKSFISGGQMTLSKFGSEVADFGKEIKKYSEYIAKVDTKKMNDVASSVKSLISSLTAANGFKSSTSLYGIGADAAQGFINGVISKLYAAANAGSRLGESTKESLRKALDIRSPSKVFEKLGEFTSEGFINGLSGVVGKASAIFTNLKSVAESRFSGIIGDVKNAISSGISGQTLSITPVLDLSEIQNQAGDIGSIIGDYSNIDIGSSFDLSSITAFGMNGFNPNSKFDSLAETIKGISSGNVTNEFNNTFDVSGYTGSTDELASRISELLQEQVERTGAVWA